MKDFDYEKAKAGAEVCTSDGREVKIIDFESPVNDLPIMAYVKNLYGEWRGCMFSRDGEGVLMRLKLKPKIRTGYVLMDARKGSLYLCGRPIPYVEYPFDKREAAENTKRDIEKNFDVSITIATITWEE